MTIKRSQCLSKAYNSCYKQSNYSNLSCFNLVDTFHVFLMHRVHVTSIVKSKYSKSCYWNNPVNVIIFCCTESILLTGFHCNILETSLCYLCSNMNKIWTCSQKLFNFSFLCILASPATFETPDVTQSANLTHDNARQSDGVADHDISGKNDTNTQDQEDCSKLIQNIYHGIIFPSLNPAKIFRFISR